MSKLSMLAAGAVGYVLGARAGRERYDQIVAVATRIWSSPPVQRAASDAQVRAREAAPVVAGKVVDIAKHAAGAAASAVRSDSENDSESEEPVATSATKPGGTRRASPSGPDPKVSHL